LPLTAASAILNPRLINFLKRRFNCVFLLQAPSGADDGQGGKATTWGWNGVAGGSLELLGAIYTLTGQEREAEGGPGVAMTHELLIAYIPGVLPTMRIQYGTRTFDINTVTDYGEQHLLLSLMCQEMYRK